MKKLCKESLRNINGGEIRKKVVILKNGEIVLVWAIYEGDLAWCDEEGNTLYFSSREDAECIEFNALEACERDSRKRPFYC